MRRTNTIFILSDEHNRSVTGCYGDPIVRTPHLDQLAERGVRFENSFCNAPVCVSSRASLATGLLPHQFSAWDSTTPFTGAPKGWAGKLRDQGHEVVSIGKLHYRSTEDDNGFSAEHAPMHVYNGVGWLSSLLRRPPVPLAGAEQMAGRIGWGETDYTAYDRKITKLTCDWLEAAALRAHDKPWVLYVGLVAPHFPLIAPQEFFDLYNGIDIPPPRQYAEADRPRHPVLDALRAASNYDDSFTEESVRIARQAYYGLCSFLDHNIGLILDALERSGQLADTRVIYTSDHGDNLGHRGLWGKSVMYEDSVGVPLIAAGPNIPQGLTVETPVSLIDIHPTITEFAGAAPNTQDSNLPGESLTARFDAPKADRAVFSEYHDWSSITGMFMLRTQEWKIVRYPGFEDQLFNMLEDPYEKNDLTNNTDYAAILNTMRTKLSAVADVDAVNTAAFEDQKAKIYAHGGPEAILKGEDLAYTPAPIADRQEALADPYEP
ncbi:MAG: sulfatase-like hydrolase/transferase [Albidovulum sp.]